MSIPIASTIIGLPAYAAGKPIEETKRELGLNEVVKLASNENPLGPSPKAIAAMQRALAELHRYPDSAGYRLKHALAKKLSDERGAQVVPEQLVLGNGSNEILVMVMRTIAQPGCNVVIGWPSFVVYPTAAQAAGLEVRAVPLVEHRYDVGAMLARVDANTRAFIVGHPNNPTGTHLPRADLERIAKALPKSTLLVVDEAYVEYADADDYVSGLRFDQPNVLVLRTLSKAYGLAGMRLGYGVGDKAFIAYLNRVREPFNVNALALVGGEAALDDHEFVQHAVALNRKERARVAAALAALGLGVAPSQGNFLLVDFGVPALPIYEAILRRGVILRPMLPYDLPNSLRVSIGTEAENDTLLAAVSAVLERSRS